MANAVHIVHFIPSHSMAWSVDIHELAQALAEIDSVDVGPFHLFLTCCYNFPLVPYIYYYSTVLSFPLCVPHKIQSISRLHNAFLRERTTCGWLSCCHRCKCTVEQQIHKNSMEIGFNSISHANDAAPLGYVCCSSLGSYGNWNLFPHISYLILSLPFATHRTMSLVSSQWN